jgi:CHAT domain-containing protein/tetratricopeptide (TPR) repeat protein
MNLGQVQEGVAYLERALAVARKHYGDDHRTTADLQSDLGRVLAEGGNFEAACAHLDRALAIRRERLGAEHHETTDTMINLGNILRRRDFVAARPLLEQALAIRRGTEGADHSGTATALVNLGLLQHDQIRYAAARASYEEALAIRRRALGPEHPDVANVLLELGNAQRDAGDCPAGRTSFEEALAIRRKALGEQSADTANAYHNLGITLTDLRREAEAQVCLEKGLAIQRKVLGDDHADTGRSLHSLGYLRETRHDQEGALECYREALRIRIKALGAEHPDTAWTHGNLGATLVDMGRYAEGKDHTEKALAIRRKVLGEDDPETARSCHVLGYVHEALGDLAAARASYEGAVRVRRKALGPDHTDTATSLNNLGNLLATLGQHAEARERLEEALAARLKILGPDHADTVVTHQALGSLLTTLGRYPEARTHLEQALAIRGKVLGGEHPDTAYTLRALGYLLFLLSDRAEALACLEKALAIRRKALGEDHPDTADSHHYLGIILANYGDRTAAREHIQVALSARRKRFGERHPLTADSMMSLALVARDEEERRALYKSTYEIMREAFGPQNPRTIAALSYLVFSSVIQWDSKEEDLPAQEAQFTELIEAYRKVYGEEHPETAGVYSNLAVATRWWALRGRDRTPDEKKTARARATDLAQKVVTLNRKIYGDEHPMTLNALAQLCDWQSFCDEHDAVRRTLEEIIPLELKFAEDLLGTMSEAEALAFVEGGLGRQPFLAMMKELPGVTPEQAYAPAWALRGLVTRTVAERRATMGGDAEARRYWDRLRETRRQLAQLTLATPTPGEQEARRQALAGLSEQKEALERDLARVSAPFRRQRRTRQATFADLARVLPPGTAVVDLIGTSRSSLLQMSQPNRPDGPGLFDESEFEAFVLRKADTPPGYALSWVHLGPADPIASAVLSWRASLVREQGREPVSGDPAPEEEATPERDLRRLVWEKVEPHLAGCTTVIVIPDGVLTQVPWAALPGKWPGSYLIEEYAIATASHGQQLFARLTQGPAPEGGELLLVGGVDYNGAPTRSTPARPAPRVADAGPMKRGATPESPGRPTWTSLPATVAEVAAIADLWPLGGDAVRLAGTEASEVTLRERLPRGRFVHLATHGFFADAASLPESRRETLLPSANLTAPGRRMTVTNRNPLILSGIVLAGAGATRPAGPVDASADDGILTAEEVADLDLSGVELVVLSACETGLGKVADGEGVFGLQRAFGLAGARTVVASLWKVDDATTQELMGEFYRNLWRQRPGLGKLEALRRAQRAMIRDDDRDRGRLRDADDRPPAGSISGRSLPPSYWAAFTLDGDWR